MTRSSFDRSQTPWLFAAAGIALVVAQVVLPPMPDDPTQQVLRVAGHPLAFMVSAAAFLVAAAALVLGVAAIGAVPVVRARRLVRAGLVVTAVGALWPATGRATFNLVMVAIVSGAPRPSALAAAQALADSDAVSILLVTLAAFALGPALLGVGLRRARLVPVWPFVLWVAGVLLVNATDTASRPLSALGMGLAAVGLGWLGLAVGRAPQDQVLLVPAEA